VYQETLDELDDIRTEAAVLERLTGFDETCAIGHDDMRGRHARKG
jgi:antitoxin StbD